MIDAANDDYVIISTDVVLERIAREQGRSYDEVFRDNIKLATKEMRENATLALSEGKNIIWDQTNMSSNKRRGILSIVPDVYKKVAVDFWVDNDILHQRLKERSATTGKTIPRHVIQNMIQNYQIPCTDEGFDEVIRVA